MDASHNFNLMDARGVIGVNQRAAMIGEIRKLARACAEELGLPFIDVRGSTMSEGDVGGYPDVEGMKFVAAGMNPMDLKRGIDKAVIAATEELKKLSKPCSDSNAIAQVGFR